MVCLRYKIVPEVNDVKLDQVKDLFLPCRNDTLRPSVRQWISPHISAKAQKKNVPLFVYGGL